MENHLDKTPGDLSDPIDRFRGGDRGALAEFFDEHRDRLRRMVELRIDAWVQGRPDPSDVLQEAFLDVDRDLGPYLADPKPPPLLWLRLDELAGLAATVTHRRPPRRGTAPGSSESGASTGPKRRGHPPRP